MVSIQAVSAFYSAYQSLGLQGISTTTDSQPPTLTFAPGTSPQVIAEITAAAAAYDWTGATAPNVAGFFAAIQNDTTLTSAEKGVLAQYFGTMAVMLQAGMGEGIPIVWSQIISAYGPAGTFGTWLTSDIQTLVVGYATANNLSLVV